MASLWPLSLGWYHSMSLGQPTELEEKNAIHYDFICVGLHFLQGGIKLQLDTVALIHGEDLEKERNYHSKR